MFIKCAWQWVYVSVSLVAYCHFQSNGSDLASNSTWYLAATLMTFSADRWGLHVTPIRRNTPLYGRLLDKPRLLPANLGMNYWKGQAEHLDEAGTFGWLNGQTDTAWGKRKKATAISAAQSVAGSVALSESWALSRNLVCFHPALPEDDLRDRS